MKQQLFYIHGGNPFTSREAFMESLRTYTLDDPYGLPTERWSEKLREMLEEQFEVFTPQMPNKQCALYEEWKLWFEKHLEFFRDGVIFTGWSLGGIFLVKYLIENELPIKIGGLILIAAPFIDGGLSDDVGRTTAPFKSDIQKLPELQDKVDYICIMQSKDDFVVPFEEAVKYHKYLPEAEYITFEDRNHFLQPKFPELIEKIKAIAGR